MSTANRDDLHISNLNLAYQQQKILKNINLTIKCDQITCLLGPNGAGKSSFFNSIIGFVKPCSGSITLGQIPITQLSVQQRTKLGIAFLPQQACIYNGLTIRDNILSVLEFFEPNGSVRQKKLQKILEDFQLTSIAHQRGSHVSGGQRRRTEIARCMATDPKLILLDEPFAGIDPIAISQIQKLILQLKEQGIGTLITDHQAQITLNFSDEANIIYEGKLLCSGDASIIRNNSTVKKLYLGS